LINAIPGIFNVLVISLLFFLLFGIFGVNYFKGQFYFCSATGDILTDLINKGGIKTMWDCVDYGGIWVNTDYSFDNSVTALLTLF
jgi:hypothetical protein